MQHRQWTKINLKQLFFCPPDTDNRKIPMTNPNPYLSPNANLDLQPEAGSAITAAMLDSLRGTKGWVMLVGIALFIGAAFMLLGAFGMMAVSNLAPASKSALPAGMTTGIAAFYVVFAIVYCALGLYLVRYSSAISRLMRDGMVESMELALQYQQKFWRLAGFLVLIAVGMMILGMGAAIVIPIMQAK